MKKLIHKVAEAVEHSIKGLPSKDAGEIMGRNAFGDLTRKIDYVAEQGALQVIKKGSLVNVMSEEMGWLDLGGEYTMVLDPIDGSLNATIGVPFYSVSIAIGKENLSSLEFALVKNLATKDVFFAERNKGATLNGKPIKRTKERKIFSVYLGGKAGDINFEVAKRSKYIRWLGCASLSLCLTATGAFRLYYQPTPGLRIVDLAASALILREAGGELYNDKIQPLEMRLRSKANQGVIAISDRRLKNEIRNSIEG